LLETSSVQSRNRAKLLTKIAYKSRAEKFHLCPSLTFQFNIKVKISVEKS
jgi:hypothetical protein